MRCLVASFVAAWVLLAALGCVNMTAPKRTASRPLLLPNLRPPPNPRLSAADINRAARLSLNKCVRCHPLYDPAAYNDGEWRSWMVKMARKAHLRTDQEDLLSRYFQALRTRNSLEPEGPAQ